MRRNARDKDSATGLSQSPPAASEVPIEFTFVNHTEDVSSIASRKSSSKLHRHVIRSHAMQRVRRLESAQGKKRTRSISNKSRASSSSTESSVSIKDEPVIQEPELQTILQARPQIVVFSATSPTTPRTPLTISPANHEYDPFCTLPSNNLPHKTSEGLLNYCFDVLLPTTFSVEFKQPKARLARQGMVLQSKMNNPATYLGFMATVAAHRAVLYGRHQDLKPSDRDHDELISDPDYKMVKHEAIVAVRTMIQNSEGPSQYIIDSCFGLVSIATVVGNFKEARIHLQGIAQVIARAGCSDESMIWLPVANVKVSVGLLEKPVLPLPWKRAAIPEKVLDRLTPPAESPFSHMGSEFRHLDSLSPTLHALLRTSRDICNFVEYSSRNPKGLNLSENTMLSHKATEVEYDLVSYPYDNPDFFVHGDNAEPFVPPLERVIRMAALGFRSFAPHAIMPSTGLGRATTCHQKDAVESWLRADKARAKSSAASAERRAVTWALFVFAQCALGQVEEDFFVSLIVQMTDDLRFLSWLEMEQLLAGYLYMPQSQATIWAETWDKARRGRDLGLVKATS
ncbi:hypothetical protein PV08_00402 [Exophiala spinifera]|uniref:Tachykinin family protein n=1 Tax=Exophiala spinifera TaxID=91928 RepID=A0A0D2A4S6_9EURO|nr:uncharacterized protein PV08_00402 [Exophiala spinifera]KIW19827.1 hypothetical protein PV08_00402 [Exophiala spinifera]